MTAAPTPTPGRYRLDPVHSTIGFAVLHKVSRFRAGFASFDATLVVAEDGSMELEGSASVGSVQVKNPDMDVHLRSPEFFDVSRHPGIAFRSTAVTLSDEEGRLVVVGDLTIRGHTERIEARGTFAYVPDDAHAVERVGIDLEATVDRTAFGMRWNMPLPRGGFALANTVTVTGELELAKA